MKRMHLTIDALGQKGDAIAALNDGTRLFVPYALPGETVEATWQDGDDRAALLNITAPSQHRITPICSEFGRCGGCVLQHADQDSNLAFKRTLVQDALNRAGLATEAEPCVDVHGLGRRRVTLHIRRIGRDVLAGFMEARSHRLLAYKDCPVLVPALKPARTIAESLGRIVDPGKKPLDAVIAASSNGLDVDLRGSGRLADAIQLRLTQEAERLDLARLSLHGETLIERRAPIQTMGPALVIPPPGGFLQATQEAEDRIGAHVCDILWQGRGPAKSKALDLFSGCGPFALRLAMTMPVMAYDMDTPAIAALTRAARGTQGLRPVTAQARDLFRRPLMPEEMKGIDIAVLDPPRAGAEAQCTTLARSHIGTIAYVSCNPASFARDASILLAGGYRLRRVTPFDQFRYTAHVELVGLFEKG